MSAQETNLGFVRHLTALRLTASVLYDRGRVAGHGHEQLMEDVKPIMDKLRELTKDAVESDLAGVVCAINFLKNEAEKHERDARYLIQKSVDTREHVKMLEAAIRDSMESKGQAERMDGSFSATVVNGEVTVR